MLTISNITVRLGGKLIINSASASIPAVSRVGLIGRNGAGKSTLLKVVGGILDVESGSVQTPRNTRVGYISQDSPAGHDSPLDWVLSVDKERAHLMAEAELASDSARISEIHERLDIIDAHSAPARVARILAGLGFEEEAQHKPLDSFSGGWRMRVALAALLYLSPELLLLDEPSNHLDLESVIWLEKFLKNYRGTLILISHERDLLNSVIDQVLHLENGKITQYTGDYDAFERERSERLAQVEATRLKQERRRHELEAFVTRWRYKAHTANQAQSRLKALARMEPIPTIIEDPRISFHFPNPKALRPPLLCLENAAVGYQLNKPVISRINLQIESEDRIAFLGRNGNGKTTLARLLAGRLKPMAGTIVSSPRLRVGYFAQNQVEELGTEGTPMQHLTRLMPDAKISVVRAQLGRFGFSGDKAELSICNLSGGERARLALALITRDAPHLLILDEPTNHLDVDVRAALVQALNAFRGAVIVVSHDRNLLGLTVDRLVVVANGEVTDFVGTLDDYRRIILNKKGSSEIENAGYTVVPKQSRKEVRRQAAKLREKTKVLRKAVTDAESSLSRLTDQLKDIDRTLFDSKTYDEPGMKLTVSELMKVRSKVERELVEAEALWVEVNEELERFEVNPI